MQHQHSLYNHQRQDHHLLKDLISFFFPKAWLFKCDIPATKHQIFQKVNVCFMVLLHGGKKYIYIWVFSAMTHNKRNIWVVFD